MSLWNRTRPIQKNCDLSVQKKAAQDIRDQTNLAKVATTDGRESVRLAAVEKLTNESLLAKVARVGNDPAVRRLAVRKLTDQSLLAEIARDDSGSATAIKMTDPNFRAKFDKAKADQAVRLQAVEKLIDQNLLAEIAKTHCEPTIRAAAMEKLTDQNVLAEIATADSHPAVRKQVVEKLTDQSVLIKIAKADYYYDVRLAAVAKLTDQNVLAEIATGDRDADVRKRAMGMLTEHAASPEPGMIASNAPPVAEKKLGDMSQPIGFLIIKEPPFPASYDRDLYIARVLCEMEPSYSSADYKSRIKFLVRQLPTSATELNSRISQDFPEADVTKTMINPFDDTDGGKGIRVSVYLGAPRTRKGESGLEMTGEDSIAPFTALYTISSSEAVDVLFSRAVPSLPIVSSDDISGICSQSLNYDVALGTRHLIAAEGRIRKVIAENVEMAPLQLNPGQKVVGYQVFIQTQLKFALLGLTIGDSSGSPGYMFGARIWRTADQLFVQGWEGFRTS